MSDSSQSWEPELTMQPAGSTAGWTVIFPDTSVGLNLSWAVDLDSECLHFSFLKWELLSIYCLLWQGGA